MRKKMNQFCNNLIGSSVGLFIGYGIYQFWDYKNNPDFYEMQSAPWYTGIWLYGMVMIAVAAAALILKLTLQKKIGKRELIILSLQLLLFYVFPSFAGPTDAMGMVVVMIAATFLLSALAGWLSDTRIKFFYPLFTAILFLPSLPIYYNESALIHSAWYLVVSAVGMVPGVAIRNITVKK